MKVTVRAKDVDSENYVEFDVVLVNPSPEPTKTETEHFEEVTKKFQELYRKTCDYLSEVVDTSSPKYAGKFVPAGIEIFCKEGKFETKFSGYYESSDEYGLVGIVRKVVRPFLSYGTRTL